MSLGVEKHNTGLHKAASPYSCFISAGMLSRYSFVLIRRQQFGSVYEECIMYCKTKVFTCDTSEKYIMEKWYQKICKKMFYYKCLVNQVYRGVEKFQVTFSLLDKELWNITFYWKRNWTVFALSDSSEWVVKILSSEGNKTFTVL